MFEYSEIFEGLIEGFELMICLDLILNFLGLLR